MCAYDKSDGSCARPQDLQGDGISHQEDEAIAANCAPVNCCTTDLNGECTIHLPPGDYIVISVDTTETVLPDLQAHDLWDAQNLEALFDRLCTEKQTKLGQIAQPIRVAVTGTSISTPIYETPAILGKEKTIARINICLGQRAAAES